MGDSAPSTVLAAPQLGCKRNRAASQEDSGLRRYVRQIHFAAGFMLAVAKPYPNSLRIQ